MAVVAMVTCGCGPPRGVAFSSLEKLASLPRGTTIREVQRRLGVRGDHYFHVARNGEDYLTVEFMYSHDEPERIAWARFWCVFRCGKLDQVVRPVRTSHADRDADNPEPLRRAQNWLSGSESRKLLSASDLAQNDIMKASQFSTKYRGCGNWAALGAVLAPFVWPIWLAEALEDARWAVYYDPFKLQLGMTPAQVEQQIGTAGCSYAVAAVAEVRLYGRGMDPAPKVETRFNTWIAVIFRNGYAAFVLSEPFVHELLPAGHPKRRRP